MLFHNMETLKVKVCMFRKIITFKESMFSCAAVAPVPAPAPVVSAPSCWTEQDTVWDTQYVDMVTQECKPVTQQVCNQVKKV